MANHVRCTLAVDRDFDAIADFCRSDDSVMDFQKILPMPEELKNTETIHCPNEKWPQEVLDARAELEKKFGFSDWYKWRLAHWGTQWNAWDTCIFENALYFKTAWNPPWGILEELMRRFPGVTYTLNADDEFCNGFWKIVVKNMEILDGSLEQQDPCPRCRWENAAKCWMEEPVKPPNGDVLI